MNVWHKIKRIIIKRLGIYNHDWKLYHRNSTLGEYYCCRKCGENLYLPTSWQPISRHVKGCSMKRDAWEDVI